MYPVFIISMHDYTVDIPYNYTIHPWYLPNIKKIFNFQIALKHKKSNLIFIGSFQFDI